MQCRCQIKKGYAVQDVVRPSSRLLLSLLFHNDVRVEFKFAAAVFAFGVFIIGFIQIHLNAEAVGTFEIGQELLDSAQLLFTELHIESPL